MVSEKKRKRYDIEKIHEYIDSASLQKQQTRSSHDEKNLELLRKKLSDEPARTRKTTASSDLPLIKSDNLAPRVVVRPREPVQKKEERVFQIVESSDAGKTQEVFTVASDVPAPVDLFSEESLYEIETVTQELFHERSSEELKKSPPQKDVTPTVSVRGQAGEDLPEWEPVEHTSTVKEIPMTDEKQAMVNLPEFEQIGEPQPPLSPPLSHDEGRMSSYESVEIEKPQEAEPEKKLDEERRPTKADERSARLEAKQKEQEAKRLKREQETKVRVEQREVQKRLKEEERLKEVEKQKAAADAREKQREEQRLLREREEKLRIEQRNLKMKEKEERKLRGLEKGKRPTPDASIVREEPPSVQTPSDEVPYFEPEATPEKPVPPQTDEYHITSRQASFEEAVPAEAGPIPTVPTEPPAHEPSGVSPKEKRQEQRRLRREQKEGLRLERIALKDKEKQDRQRKRQEEKKPERSKPETMDKEEQRQKRTLEKQARRDEKERERRMKKEAKAQQKKEQHAIAMQDYSLRSKEKEKQQQKREEFWEEQQGIADLPLGEETEPRAEHELQKAVEQLEKEAAQAAVKETKEQRKLKAVERAMQKEREKKEKEERKSKRIEAGKEKKKMDLHFEEEILKEKQSSAGKRTDVFHGFDSIDQETAALLNKKGYTSVEKLLEATVKDLMKIGIKKKIAQSILAESKEFVEWKVFEADEGSAGKSGASP